MYFGTYKERSISWGETLMISLYYGMFMLVYHKTLEKVTTLQFIVLALQVMRVQIWLNDATDSVIFLPSIRCWWALHFTKRQNDWFFSFSYIIIEMSYGRNFLNRYLRLSRCQHANCNSMRNCQLQWRHNECDGVSNHQRFDGLLNRLFRRRSKKTSKLRVTGDRWIPFTKDHAEMFPFDDVIMTFV